MKAPIGSLAGLTSKGLVGPWQCEECGEISQVCEITSRRNTIYCLNESCDFKRIIDKWSHIIIENDGTAWSFDEDGAKTRIRLP